MGPIQKTLTGAHSKAAYHVANIKLCIIPYSIDTMYTVMCAISILYWSLQIKLVVSIYRMLLVFAASYYSCKLLHYYSLHRVEMGHYLSLSAGVPLGDVLVNDVQAVNINGSDCLTASLWITGVDGMW